MSVNKVILVGNLGKDPEARYTPSGVAVTTFSIATTEKYKDRDGNKQEKTEWHNIVAWRQLAEICAKWLVKGKQVYIEGKLTTRSYDDRDGNKRYVTEIVAGDMKMLGAKGDHQPAGQKTQPQDYQAKPTNQVGQHNSPEGPTYDDDDEIPF